MWRRPADRAPSPPEVSKASEASARSSAPGPERVLALTDGIVAIAITLLVLDLNAVDYHGSSAEALWRVLREESDRFIAFFIAFWVIARFWMAHHQVFRRITRHEDLLARRNFWFLFGISVVPFTTAVLGESSNNPLAVTLFSANLLTISLSLHWLSASAERLGAAAPIADQRSSVLVRARTVTTAVLFALPGALAWIIRPNTALLLFLLFLVAGVPGQFAAWWRTRRAGANVAAAPPHS